MHKVAHLAAQFSLFSLFCFRPLFTPAMGAFLKFQILRVVCVMCLPPVPRLCLGLAFDILAW